MNVKIAIPMIAIGIIVIIWIFAITSQESKTIEVENTFDKELQSTNEITSEIQGRLGEIERENLENEYLPKP